MIDKYNSSEFAVVSDFDGTISITDTNELLFGVLGNDENRRIEARYRAGEIGTKEGFVEHFKALSITIEWYERFISENARLDEGFQEFYGRIREVGVSFCVVSGGFEEGIAIAFKNAGILPPMIYANSLIMREGRLMPRFAHERESCNKPFGVCGNCKERHIINLKDKGKKVVYIGDGLTDRCCAECADIVFAKNDFAEFCASVNIAYIGYKSFKDIEKTLFG